MLKLNSQREGNALILVLMMVVVLAGVVVAGQMLSSTQILLTSRSADVDSMQSTAEGLVNYAYGVWRDGMKDSATPLTSAEATALITGAKRPAIPSWMQYESFVITALDSQGIDASAPVAVPTLSQEPKGWQATSYEYAARVTLVATTVTKKPKRVTVEAVLRHDLVPPVGGLFYCEGDFELFKPAPMIIGGNVHSNANGYVSTAATATSDKLRFLSSSNISFVGSYSQAAPPGGADWSPVSSSTDVQSAIYDRGMTNQVRQTERLEGIGMGTASEFDTNDNNPNNDGNHELIEPPVAGFADPPGIANSRIYNNAGLIVDVSGPVTGTINVTLNATTGAYEGNNVRIKPQNGTTLTAAQAKAIVGTISNAMDVTTTSTQQVWNAQKKKYETQTVTTTTTVHKTVYDKREGAEVTVSDVSLASLNTTLNSLSNFNNILYLRNTDADSSPSAVRLTNAGVLPDDGLTVATPGGLYVVGDYNTGTTTDSTVVPANANGNADGTAQPYKTGYSTKPAALVADAVMFLSNSWSDANDSKSVSSRPAKNTTVNAAVIAGFIPSEWTNPDTQEQYWYSGGANNFPRFLENWSGKTMTFYGAMVQLFKSEMFTGMWDTGDIYSPPTRRWNFDTLLLSRVIPGIPAASVFSVGQMRTL